MPGRGCVGSMFPNAAVCPFFVEGPDESFGFPFQRGVRGGSDVACLELEEGIAERLALV